MIVQEVVHSAGFYQAEPEEDLGPVQFEFVIEYEDGQEEAYRVPKTAVKLTIHRRYPS